MITRACVIFQSTRPIRGATLLAACKHILRNNFNPRAPYGARLGRVSRSAGKGTISIHAPHTGRDPEARGQGPGSQGISIHAPHTGRDLKEEVYARNQNHFNPRAPYGARPSCDRQAGRCRLISIHAPHTGRDPCVVPLAGDSKAISIHAPHTGRDPLVISARSWDDTISIHAPHTGRDLGSTSYKALSEEFQSTRPIRGATQLVTQMSAWAIRISIHAPHTGRDRGAKTVYLSAFDFNPRAPYGARPGNPPQVAAIRGISIHAPHTGRDHPRIYFKGKDLEFQSTRPIRGATQHRILLPSLWVYFNPRAPYGARPTIGVQYNHTKDISIHAPHTGRDHRAATVRTRRTRISIHAPHTGRDHAHKCLPSIHPHISIHAPHTGRDPKRRE